MSVNYVLIKKIYVDSWEQKREFSCTGIYMIENETKNEVYKKQKEKNIYGVVEENCKQKKNF